MGVAAVAVAGGKQLVPARSQRRRCVPTAESWPGISSAGRAFLLPAVLGVSDPSFLSKLHCSISGSRTIRPRFRSRSHSLRIQTPFQKLKQALLPRNNHTCLFNFEISVFSISEI